MAIALSVLPIILVIACGYLMVAARLLPSEQWAGIEILSFRLLIPAVIIKAIATSDISLDRFGPLIINIISALLIAGLIVFLFRLFASQKLLPNPAFTTLFQTTTRWNVYIALAAAEQFIGPDGLIFIAVVMAFLIPPINVGNIVVLACFGPSPASVKNTILMLVKNPLIQGCVIGLVINLTSTTLPGTILQTLDIIGRAALGIGLLAVGAGISFSRLMNTSLLIWLGVILRLGLCPCLFIALAQLFSLDSEQILAGVLILAVPAASNGYIIAKQMGGDADLYADVLFWQTILSLLLLPVFAVLWGQA